MVELAVSMKEIQHDLSEMRKELYHKKEGLFVRVERLENAGFFLKWLAGSGVISGLVSFFLWLFGKNH